MKHRTLTLCVAILGVILTGASVIASIAQWKAAALQARAAMVALEPQLEVRVIAERDETGSCNNQRIELTSDGAPAYNLRVQHLTWFTLAGGQGQATEQPLDGYYFGTTGSGRTRGELQLLFGYHNADKLDALDRSLHRVSSAPSGVCTPVTILRLTYTDALRTEHEDFFLVERAAVTLVTEAEGRDTWKHAEQMRDQVGVIDLDQIGDPRTFDAWLPGFLSRCPQRK